jgi:hypothetical protein
VAVCASSRLFLRGALYPGFKPPAGLCYLSSMPPSWRWQCLVALGRYPQASHLLDFVYDTFPGSVTWWSPSITAIRSVTHVSGRPSRFCLEDAPLSRVGALSDLLSTPLGATALSPELRSYLNTSRRVFASSVRIPSHLSSFAAEAGLLSNPHAPPHGHPFHKALEEKLHSLLHAVVQGKAYTLLSRKDSPAPLAREATHVANNILTGQDLTRYPNGIFSAPIVPTPLAVLSDTLQMLTPADVDALFQRSPDLKHLFCSAVVAPEPLTGAPDFHPEVYTLSRTF